MRKLTKHEAQNLASHLVTGDMISQVPAWSIVSFGIGLFTDFRNTISGRRWVARHIAPVVRRLSGNIVIIQTDKKHGVRALPADKWLMKYGSDIRIWRWREPMNGNDFRSCVEALEGLPYERVLDFLRIAIDKNKSGLDRQMCAEVQLRGLKSAGQPDVLDFSNDNVEPDELDDRAAGGCAECLYDSNTPTLQGKCVVAK